MFYLSYYFLPFLFIIRLFFTVPRTKIFEVVSKKKDETKGDINAKKTHKIYRLRIEKLKGVT